MPDAPAVEPEPGPIKERMPSADDCVVTEDGAKDVFIIDAPSRLLTRYEYDNSVRDLLSASASPARPFRRRTRRVPRRQW